MPLFHHSSRNGVPLRSAWRSVAVAIGLLLGYHVCIIAGWIPPSDGLSEMSRNRSALESYIFRSPGRADIALAGSSYTSVLLPSYFTPPAFNLGLGGNSSATGIAVIRRLPDPPRVLFVEMSDSLVKGVDYQLIDCRLSPTNNLLYRHLPMLRDSYQPVNVCLSLIKRWRKGGGLREGVAADYRRILMLRHTQSDHLAPFLERLRAKLPPLRADLDELCRTGVRVILFRPPRDPEIERTNRIQQIDALLHDAFPATTYEWLPMPAGLWRTRDGSHLSASSAADYAVFLNGAASHSPDAPIQSARNADGASRGMAEADNTTRRNGLEVGRW